MQKQNTHCSLLLLLLWLVALTPLPIPREKNIWLCGFLFFIHSLAISCKRPEPGFPLSFRWKLAQIKRFEIHVCQSGSRAEAPQQWPYKCIAKLTTASLNNRPKFQPTPFPDQNLLGRAVPVVTTPRLIFRSMKTFHMLVVTLISLALDVDRYHHDGSAGTPVNLSLPGFGARSWAPA